MAEATVPPGFVLTQIPHELAPAAGHIKWQHVGPATGDDLSDQARGQIADVHDHRE
jgi:hypothetical protein